MIMLICFGSKMNSDSIVTGNTKWVIETKRSIFLKNGGGHEIYMTRKRVNFREKKGQTIQGIRSMTKIK